eukprot:2782380-Pyramimonas_sp.AAC.1
MGQPRTNSPTLHITAREVIAATGVSDFSTHQSIARLKYLPRLLNSAPRVLLRLLDNIANLKRGWVQLLKNDFNFHRTYLRPGRWHAESQEDHHIDRARRMPKEFNSAVGTATNAFLTHACEDA